VTRDELLEDLSVVQAQKGALPESSPAMPAVRRREQLILNAIATMDANAAVTVPTERRYFVVDPAAYVVSEAHARRLARDTYEGRAIVVAVDVPIPQTLTGTVVPANGDLG